MENDNRSEWDKDLTEEHESDTETDEFIDETVSANVHSEQFSEKKEGGKLSESENGGAPDRKRDSVKRTELICLIVIGFIYAAVALANIFQTDRPTVSMSENRNLTPMPEFSMAAIADGTYFRQLSLFFSDTFIERENLVRLSKKIERFYGISGDFSILIPSDGIGEETNDADFDKQLQDALNKLESLRQEAEKTEPETEAETAPDTEPEETEEVTAPPPTVSLSKTYVKLPAGSSTTLEIAIENGSEEYALAVEIGSDIITVSVAGSTLNLYASTAGNTYVKVSYGDSSFVCDVEVTSVTLNGEDNAEADFITGGTFIYKDAVYIVGYYGPQTVGYLSQCLDYYKQLFPDTRVSIVTAPVSALVIDDPKITSRFPSQLGVYDSMASRMSDKVNFVNAGRAIFEHRDEYVFFKSDHHWTQLGAYYAYSEFAKSVGFAPTPLSEMEHLIVNENYHGSMYGMTQDERVKEFYDTVEMYYPTKSATMTVTNSHGNTITYNEVIPRGSTSYGGFIGGDNPYTVINVPENPQDLTALVLKDSHGNAFVPFLTEHYGNIIVIDPRYCDINIYDEFKDYGLTDIILAGNVQSHNSLAWTRYFFRLVGVDFDSIA